MTRTGSDLIKNWPDESREAAQLVIDKHGEPHEGTGSGGTAGSLPDSE